MGHLVKLLPAASLLLLVLTSALSLGAGSGTSFVLPALPILAVHYWTRRQRGLMPVALVFAAGLAIDLLTYGPLGYWPLLFLAGTAVSLASARLLRSRHPIVELGATLTVLGAVAGAGWLLASAYFSSAVDPSPILLAVPVLGAVSLPLSWLFGRLAGCLEGPASPPLAERA